MKPEDFFYPEINAGGFSRVDGTIAFYQRVRSLVKPDMKVLDFGAGRGGAHLEDCVLYRRGIRNLAGSVRRLTVCDIDEAVLAHPAADERVHLSPGSPLPFDDKQFDLIYSDFVFEHIDSPESVASELDRVLQDGGWICARTTNRWGYVAILSSLIPRKLHSKLLAVLQPSRKREDVFPARYRMNSLAQLRRLFPNRNFELISYFGSAEPSYAASNWLLYPIFYFLHWVLPEQLQTTLYVFARKRNPKERYQVEKKELEFTRR